MSHRIHVPDLDPRRPIVEVMARLGRETQLHIDERERHFKITDGVIIAISVILIVLAVFNVYYVRVLSNELDVIVDSMDGMLGNLQKVDADMAEVAGRVQAFDQHIQRMTPIQQNVAKVTDRLPVMSTDMDVMAANMQIIHQDMQVLGQAVSSITPSMTRMTQNMGVMRHNVRQIARPMGAMNPVLP